MKETVCPKTAQESPEQCDFKENGVSLGAGGKEDAFQMAEQGTHFQQDSQPLV